MAQLECARSARWSIAQHSETNGRWRKASKASQTRQTQSRISSRRRRRSTQRVGQKGSVRSVGDTVSATRSRIPLQHVDKLTPQHAHTPTRMNAEPSGRGRSQILERACDLAGEWLGEVGTARPIRCEQYGDTLILVVVDYSDGRLQAFPNILRSVSSNLSSKLNNER